MHIAVIFDYNNHTYMTEIIKVMLYYLAINIKVHLTRSSRIKPYF